jgi:hypothetical protein
MKRWADAATGPNEGGCVGVFTARACELVSRGGLADVLRAGAGLRSGIGHGAAVGWN